MTLVRASQRFGTGELTPKSKALSLKLYWSRVSSRFLPPELPSQGRA